MSSKMNYLVAIEELASIIKLNSPNHHAYFWKLSGDDPNSLCKLLNIGGEEMKSLLRPCQIYMGSKDRMSTNNLAKLVQHVEVSDCTHHRPVGCSTECFIRPGEIGVGDVVKAKDQLDDDGDVSVCPIDGKHMSKRNTGPQRSKILKLLRAVESDDDNTQPAADDKGKDADAPKTPKSILMSFISKLVAEGATTGNESIASTDSRKLKRLVNDVLDAEAKLLLHDVASKMSDITLRISKEELVSPGRATSGPAAVASPNIATPMALQTEMEEEANAIQSVSDEFLEELKQEVLLQSLLHKRIHEKKERAFSLEHKNGRRLLVAPPPDSKTASSFVQEADKSKWIDTMLNSDERAEGMLTHLARNQPEKYEAVAKKNKLSTRVVHLTTAQTLALARVGNLNDVRLRNVKAFLRKVAGVTIVHSMKDVREIDEEVGINATKDGVTFGSTVHEWAASKSKKLKKKPPEEVKHWNSSLSNETVAEVDIHIARKLHENPKLKNTVPSISHIGDGFNDEGVTVCVGGDHGDGHCPIGAKINLTSPEERKKRKQLNCGCPVASFASIECAKDAHEVLNKTIMPKAKSQLLELEQQAIIAIFHSKNNKKFKSFMMPKNTKANTIAFRRTLNTNQPEKVEMVYGCGDDMNGLALGSLKDLTFFSGMPWFELRCSVTVKSFRQLFIGDLAFLAMLM